MFDTRNYLHYIMIEQIIASRNQYIFWRCIERNWSFSFVGGYKYNNVLLLRICRKPIWKRIYFKDYMRQQSLCEKLFRIFKSNSSFIATLCTTISNSNNWPLTWKFFYDVSSLRSKFWHLFKIVEDARMFRWFFQRLCSVGVLVRYIKCNHLLSCDRTALTIVGATRVPPLSLQSPSDPTQRVALTSHETVYLTLFTWILDYILSYIIYPRNKYNISYMQSRLEGTHTHIHWETLKTRSCINLFFSRC